MMILLLEDDETFRTALSEFLRDDGHSLQAYASIAELPPLSELPAPAVLITECQLARREDGLSFARHFNAMHPAQPDDLVKLLLGARASIVPDEIEIETEWKLIQSKPGDAEGYGPTRTPMAATIK